MENLCIGLKFTAHQLHVHGLFGSRLTGKYNYDGSQKDVQTGNRYNVRRELIEL